MDYQVLARKFRPQSFESVAGQEHVVRTLSNAIVSSRIAHAFLFSGPRGVGKTSVARILAKSINCENGPTKTPCNVCANCREITEGCSLDVREIDGASNRGIDEIRELRENIRFAPASSRYKIYIIDEVHMLTREAFNALLKTLEEPPAHVIFIFATTENHKVPATILSRCQCYDFRRISLAEITANLGRLAAAEHIQISKAAMSWIAEAGDGSMRDAQSIFDQVISYAGQNIEDHDVEEILGLVDQKYLFRLSASILSRDAGSCLSILEEAYLAGLDMKHFYQMLLKHFRNMLLVKIAGENISSFDIPPEQIETLKTQAAATSRETIQRHLEILLAEEDKFRRSEEIRFKLESIIVRMAYLAPIIPLGDIISTIENIEQKLRQGVAGESIGEQKKEKKAPAALLAPAESAVKENITKAKPDQEENKQDFNQSELTENFKKYIKKESPILGAKISAAEIVGFEGDGLILNFPKDYIFLDDLNEKRQKEQLEQIAKNFFKKTVTIKISTAETDKKNSVNENPRNIGNSINDIKREALNNPLLQKVYDEFDGAEIVEIKTRNDKHH